VAGITTVAVCGVASGAWMLTHRHNDGPSVPRYASASDMAHRAGCGATFQLVTAPAGVQSAGECTVSGNLVQFRVQGVVVSANPWPSPTGSARVPLYVGNGWIVRATDVHTLNAVGARLAP
jgi:hypothetical protein